MSHELYVEGNKVTETDPSGYIQSEKVRSALTSSSRSRPLWTTRVDVEARLARTTPASRLATKPSLTTLPWPLPLARFVPPFPLRVLH